MALENTAAGNLSDWTAPAAVLAENFFNGYAPKILRVFSQIHHDSNPIARTEVKRYRVRTDPGEAVAGPGEATRLSNTYQAVAATNIEVTSTEFVADLAEFSFQAIADTMGLSLDAVAEIMTNGSSEQIQQLLSMFVGDLVYRALRTAESAAIALFAGLGSSVGTSTQDWTLARMLAPRYQFRINQPHRSIREAKYIMPEIGISDVETEVLSTSGGVGGALWMQQAHYSIAENPGDAFANSGLLGQFLGHDVITIDPELNLTANGGADVLGFFGVPGVPGIAPDDPSIGGNPGAFCFYERMKHRVDAERSFEGRGGKLRSIWHGGFVETSDKDGVKLIIDAP